ncbi:TIR domain-containing protein [Pedococcus soli]
MDDVDTIIGYLKNKPTGATIADAKAIITGKPLDPRKMNAYKTWGLVELQGEKVLLSNEGWRIARKPEEKAQVLSAVIDRTRPYRGAVEWAHHQEFDTLTLNDLTAHWHQHHSEALGTTIEGSIKDAVTCFFNLAEGAGLGSYVLGRRGTETRLELNKGAVKSFVESGPSVPPWTGPSLEDDPAEAGAGAPEPIDSADEASPVPHDSEQQEAAPRGASGSARRAGDKLRVFIAHGQNMRVVEQVQTMLDLADIVAEVAEEEESTAIPVPNKVLAAMRRSDAGIICVNADERRRHENGTYTINENVLIEIGAAFVLYDTRVILLWDKRLPVPSNLQGLYRCEYEGEEIGWDAGMKLMKAVSKFRTDS